MPHVLKACGIAKTWLYISLMLAGPSLDEVSLAAVCPSGNPGARGKPYAAYLLLLWGATVFPLISAYSLNKSGTL